jgi:mannitol/fructose-specific phosphotransferase system IIA component (Ntr-type)
VIEPRLLIARAPKGIDWSSADDTPVVLIVVALCPAESSETAFYDLLARGLAIVKLQRHRQKLIDAPTPAARQLAVRELGS